MTIEVRPFDAGDIFTTKRHSVFLDEAAESDDPSFIARAKKLPTATTGVPERGLAA